MEDNLKKDIFKVAGKSLKSRLIVGTGKYKSFIETAKAVKASGADMVTVAVRRVNILDKKKPIWKFHFKRYSRKMQRLCRAKQYKALFFSV